MIHENYNQKIGIIQNISCSFSHNVPKAVLTISHPSISNYQFQIFPLNQQLYVSQKNLSPEPPRFKTFPCTSAGNKEIYSPLSVLFRNLFGKFVKMPKEVNLGAAYTGRICISSFFYFNLGRFLPILTNLGLIFISNKPIFSSNISCPDP